MAAHGKNGRWGRPPSSNGDPFQAFVIRELQANRQNWVEQRRFNRDQDRVNGRLMLLLNHLLERAERQDRFNKEFLDRLGRQDRINRLTLKEFKRLRRHR